MKRARLAIVLGLAVLGGGCGASDPLGCTPDQERECTCTGGAAGTQACLPDGSGYTPCDCCQPACTGKECGDDGCGGSCGTCTAPETCGPGGQCGCVPDCGARECGPDPVCGASCGTCTAPETCGAGGQCGCVPDCGARECGPDPVCGTSCGTCTAPEACQPDGTCVCLPGCAGKECGSDGCGGSCGDCTPPETCDAAGSCACVPDCAGRECGRESRCGTSCGDCPVAGEVCDPAGQCVPDTSCPDLGGTYDIFAYCGMLDNDLGVPLTQTGCELAFTLDGMLCTGRVDAQLDLRVECAGLGIPCQGVASLNSMFTLVCSPQCSFILGRHAQGQACAHHRDPDCDAASELCGVMADAGALSTRCLPVLPDGRQPGTYCNEAAGLRCENSLCVEGACGAICEGEPHCADFEGTACQEVTYTLSGVSGTIHSCTPVNPGETACRRTPDCSPARVCALRQTADDVWTVCRPPNPGGAQAGAACSAGTECETGLCLCGATPCGAGEEGTCSELCLDGADCAQGATCGPMDVPDLGGMNHQVTACLRDAASCGRHADCPAGQACTVQLGPDGLSLDTGCLYGGGPGYDNTGADCMGDGTCFAMWCSPEGYCQGVCLSDADCPTFDTPTACVADDGCPLGQLCMDGSCARSFTCWTHALLLGEDAQHQPVYDTIQLCTPQRRACALDADCRAGEACRVFTDQAATGALYQCEAGGPGTGTLGADCTAGADACWSGLCLREGQGGPGNEYCSQACTTDADCEPQAEYSCQAQRVDVRPGFVSYLPACARR